MPGHTATRATRAPVASAELLALATLATLALACGRDGAPTPGTEPPAAPAARRVVELRTPAWLLADADSTLEGALALAADDSTAYLLAADGRRLVALDARDGQARWTLPRPGTATPDLLRATAVARTPLGNLALLDGAARRVHVVGAEGRLRETVALPPDDEPTWLCPLADGAWLVAGGDPLGRLVALRPDGAVDWTLELPWAGADSLQRLQLQALLAATPDGARCVAALRLGRGFATVRPGAPPAVTSHAYVEPVAIPPIRTSERRDGATVTTFAVLDDAPAAAASVAIADSTLLVAFEGATAERRRVIDLFALDDGAYRGSLLHAAPIVGVAAWGTRLYVLHRRRGRFALAAHDVPALAAGVPAGAPTRPLVPTTTASAAARRSPR